MFTHLLTRIDSWRASRWSWYYSAIGCCAAFLVSVTFGQSHAPDSSVPEFNIRQQLTVEASSLDPLIDSAWVKQWLRQGSQLPRVDRFEVTIGDKRETIDEQLFYVGRYGSPLAYARAFDLAAKRGLDGLGGKRVLDFGYGGIGQLRMMALAGADVTGIDVSPWLKVVYARHAGPLGAGHVRLLNGRFPTDAKIVAEAGEGYDLFISKNTLKRGYIHPSREADPRMLVELGVSDAEFLNAVHRSLKPGGLFVIYNLCPAKAPADKPYIPWAEGETPFSRQQFTSARFDVLDFDVEDHSTARKLGRALGWDQGEGAMDLEHDLFAWYTIARRKT